MRWLPSISFSSSSSSRSSSSSLKSRGSESPSGRIVDVSTGWSFGPVRKLTRQRKLRHLNKHDISGPPEPLAQHVLSPSNDADFSTPRFSSTAATASSAKPQPLPLPELGIFGRKDGLSSSYVDFQLPSPTTGPSRGVEERDRGGAFSNSPIKR